MLLRPSALLAAAVSFFAPADAPPPPVEPPAEVQPLTPQEICADDAECLARRWLLVDFAELGVEGLSGQRWLSYDYDEVTRAVPYTEFEGESELSLAVRLLISEVGADRLLMNQLGLMEAIGILYTVDNRLNPFTSNPARFARFNSFPGCGPYGDFATCTTAIEYIGMDTWRAVDPSSRYPAAMLQSAVDLAVVAWHLQEEGLVADPTGRATSYVHRCGGAAYGMTTWHCDGSWAQGIRDVPGANPVTGPIVFKRPERKGHRVAYRMVESVQIDYVPLESGQLNLAMVAIDPLIRESDDALVQAD
ncbi:MAG: hypothetical protein H6740_26320 [Alphaproteobacteria bacterium]|nr:hypothetical protein [Alphaproteobacteria bacterium]